jgi:GntR family transcriptional regulator
MRKDPGPDSWPSQSQSGGSISRPGGMLGGPRPQPLYRQVKSHLVNRVLAGEWRPGESLPSEMKLAEEYGLSQGTVRKAIEEMASEGLVSRQAGRGTFVTSHSGDRRPFRFHRLRADDGNKIAGDNVEFLHCRETVAPQRAAAGLGLPLGAPVTEVLRLRQYGGRPVLVELIYLPTGRFAGIGALLEAERPASIYLLMERRHNILVTQVDERVRARVPDAQEIRLLELAPQAPVLEVERVAYSLGGEPVEWRTMTCATDHLHYSVTSQD